jgi:hypothetical protein
MSDETKILLSDIRHMIGNGIFYIRDVDNPDRLCRVEDLRVDQDKIDFSSTAPECNPLFLNQLRKLVYDGKVTLTDESNVTWIADSVEFKDGKIVISCEK